MANGAALNTTGHNDTTIVITNGQPAYGVNQGYGQTAYQQSQQQLYGPTQPMYNQPVQPVMYNQQVQPVMYNQPMVQPYGQPQPQYYQQPGAIIIQSWGDIW